MQPNIASSMGKRYTDRGACSKTWGALPGHAEVRTQLALHTLLVELLVYIPSPVRNSVANSSLRAEVDELVGFEKRVFADFAINLRVVYRVPPSPNVASLPLATQRYTVAMCGLLKPNDSSSSGTADKAIGRSSRASLSMISDTCISESPFVV